MMFLLLHPEPITEYVDLSNFYASDPVTVPGADTPTPAHQAILDQEASATYDDHPTVGVEAVVTYDAESITPDMHAWLSPEAVTLDETGSDQGHPGDHPADEDQT